MVYDYEGYYYQGEVYPAVNCSVCLLATLCLASHTLPIHNQLAPQLQAPHHVEGHRSSAFASISLPCISSLWFSLWDLGWPLWLWLIVAVLAL